jgi:hypothetical protein
MKELFGLKDADGKKYKLLVESYRDSFTISGILPEQEIPKFKIGDWVVWFGGKPTIGRIKKHCLEFGDSWELTDIPKDSKGVYNSCSEVYLRLATKQEVGDHLISIAISKGFVLGAKYKNLTGSINTVDEALTYSRFEDDTIDSGFNSGWIYCNGEWAEIISDKKKLPKTKEEAKKFLTDYYSNGNIINFLNEYED